MRSRLSWTIALAWVCLASNMSLSQTGDGEQVAAKQPVVVRGAIETSRVVRFDSPATGVLARLVKNGAIVKTGDVLAVISTPDLEDDLAAQQIIVAKAKAALKAAEFTLKRAQLHMQAESQMAKGKLLMAETRLETYVDSELPLQRAAIQVEIEDAEDQIVLAQRYTRDVNNAERRREAEVALASHKRKLDLAKKRLAHLDKAESKMRKIELEAGLAVAQVTLKLVEEQFKSEVAQAAADLEAAKIDLELKRQRLDRLIKKVKDCNVRAPHPGIVRHTGTRAQLREGEQVRERQPLLEMPDLASLHVVATVPQGSIARIKVGQPVTVHVDAYVDQPFQGQVSKIHALPRVVNPRRPDDKQFVVEVQLKDTPQRLHVGMTAEVQIQTNGTP